MFVKVIRRFLRLSISLSFSVKTVLLAIVLGLLVPLLAAIPSIHAILHEMSTSHRNDANQVIEYSIQTTKSKPLLPPFVVMISVLLSICGIPSPRA